MSNSHPHWERGGLYSETGPLERLLPVGELMVPNDVELEGEWLCWGWRGDPLQWTTRRPGPHILSDFVRLADGDGPTIRAYARRWGILGICEHGLPSSHLGNEDGTPRCRPLSRREDPAWRFDGWAPLERWRHFARQARAILDLAASLHADQPGQPEDWQVVVQHRKQPVPWWRPSVETEWILLSSVVQEWIRIGDVRPVMARGPTQGRQVEFGSSAAGHVPLRDLGLSVAVHDHTGDQCGGVLRVCRDLHTHTAAAARSAAILPVVPRRRSAPTRCAAGSAAPTTGGAAVDRPDVVLPVG